MAGIGRGRARGRGRGGQMSFDYNQLGFSGNEGLPAPVLQPPPVFPLLQHKPIALKPGLETEYIIALKKNFVEYFHSILQNNQSLSAIERFSDKYQVMDLNLKDSWDSQINWEILPNELNPKSKKLFKKKDESTSTHIMKKKKKIDISTRLDELAQMEDKEENESEDVKDSVEKDQDEDNDAENLEEDEDEEMDDGTDYVNNYFDNGESYFDDEDDNLDDGPIY